MTDTFTFTPSYASRRSFKPQVNVMRFGDGYLQAAPSGINPVVRRYDLSFEKITDAQAKDIEDFLALNIGLSFYWTPPGDATQSLWICLEEYSREHVTYNVNNMRITLEQQGVYRTILSPWDFDFSTLDGWTLYDPNSRTTSITPSASGTTWQFRLPPSPPVGTPYLLLWRPFPAFGNVKIDFEYSRPTITYGNYAERILLIVDSGTNFPTTNQFIGVGTGADPDPSTTYHRVKSRFYVPEASSSPYYESVTTAGWVIKPSLTLMRDARTCSASLGNLSTLVPPSTLTTDPTLIGPKAGTLSFGYPTRIGILISAETRPSNPAASTLLLKRLKVTPIL